MTRLFRSKSALDSSGEEEEEEHEEEDEYSGPFLSPERRERNWGGAEEDDDERGHTNSDNNNQQSPILNILVAALRKSLVTCSVERDDVANMDIGWPTNVRHVSHVTFDRFNGFLGLPVELEPEVPRKVPSASASVFGVSAQSMQCTYDDRGNSVPTILLKMQSRLYSEGGLQAEGIFRINAENSQEENVRNQLNRGIVPPGIDVHCLAGMIKAWFRELPTGILDSLSPEQVMHCNAEEQCTQLVNLLPPTEAALLDWAVNLMADVVQNECYNKMNARNIAMVFAPNMTQMADPLTALIHAVQVMNLLKTLITKTLREREESAATCQMVSSTANFSSSKVDSRPTHTIGSLTKEHIFNEGCCERQVGGNLSRSATLKELDSDSGEQFWSFNSSSNTREECDDSNSKTSPVARKRRTLESRFREGYDSEEVEGILDRLNFRKGMRKLCRHPVFQLSKSVKMRGILRIVNNRGDGGEAWA